MDTLADPERFTTRRTPLTPDQAAEAAQVGLRLLAEFRPLLDRLPQHARTGLGLARHLDIDRGTATRFVGAFARPADGLDVLHQFPGVRGLRQLLDAMGKRQCSKAALGAARAAVDRFERLIHDLGGSQSRLTERIAATHAGGRAETPEDHEQILRDRRRGLFTAAADALGQRMDLLTICQIYRPTPGKGGGGGGALMDQAMLRGTFGYRARRDAPPYALRSFGRNDGPGAAGDGDGRTDGQVGDRAYQRLEGAGEDGVPAATVFRDFSTDPPPIVTSRGRGREAVVLIDAERSGEERGVDLTLGQLLDANWRLPALDTPPTHDVSVYIGTPTARLVFDVFLHRSMARQCVPSLRLYRTTPAIFSDPSAHWYDQLPYPPAMQIISADPPPPLSWSSRLHRRQPELLGAFFGKLGWTPEEFTGFRVEVEYPYWCGFYSILFDYRAPAVTDGEGV